MKPPRTHILFTLGLLCFVLFILVKTLDLGHTARLVPEKVTLFCLPLLLIQAAVDLFPSVGEKARKKYTKLFGDQDDPSRRKDHRDGLAGQGSSPATSRERGMFWVLAIPFLVFIFGLTPTVFLYSFGYLKFRGGSGWWRSSMIAGILGASVYMLFEHALAIPLYRGQLFGWLGI
jgi:hypothetical protein